MKSQREDSSNIGGQLDGNSDHQTSRQTSPQTSDPTSAITSAKQPVTAQGRDYSRREFLSYAAGGTAALFFGGKSWASGSNTSGLAATSTSANPAASGAKGVADFMPRLTLWQSPPDGRWDILNAADGLLYKGNQPSSGMVLGLHQALLKNGRVLFIGHNNDTYQGDMQGTAAVLLPPSATPFPTSNNWLKRVDPPNIPFTSIGANPFCGHNVFLPDGRLLVAGGLGDGSYSDRRKHICLFTGQGAGGEWEITHLMATNSLGGVNDRYYPTTCLLGDGRVFILSGATNWGNAELSGNNVNKEFELYPADTTVPRRALVSFLESDPFYSIYTFIKLLPTGHLFIQAGEHTCIFNANTWAAPTGSELFTTEESYSRTFPECGTCVLLPLRPPYYRATVMLIGGGGRTYSEYAANNSCVSHTLASCIKLDTWTSTPAWNSSVASMNFPRALPDSVILPNGKILVVNGGSTGFCGKCAETPVPEAEMYDPVTDTWEVLAASPSATSPDRTIERLYHATALLLPDGRVLSAGTDGFGRLRTDQPTRDPMLPPLSDDDQKEAEYRITAFTPPYHDGVSSSVRPVLTSCDTEIVYGQRFFISTPDTAKITSVVLIRPGAVTHHNDSDHRLVELPIISESVVSGTGFYVEAPPNPNIAPPGYYMLFLVDNDPERGNGAHSDAKFINLYRPQPMNYLVKTWACNDEAHGHWVGQPPESDASAWVGYPGTNAEGYLQYVPRAPTYAMNLAPGRYYGVWKLAVADHTSDNSDMIRLEVSRYVTSSYQEVISSRVVTRQVWTQSNVYEEIILSFEIPESYVSAPPIIELRSWWYGTSTVCCENVSLLRVTEWNATTSDMAHDTGAVDGSNALTWTCAPTPDSAGLMLYGPDTPTYQMVLTPGDYTATWKMRIDNNTSNDDPVAYVEAIKVGSSSTTRLARPGDTTSDPAAGKLPITRRMFASTTDYQEFAINFNVSTSEAPSIVAQLRMGWDDNATINVRSVALRQKYDWPGVHSEQGHRIGHVDSSDATVWVCDPSVDNYSAEPYPYMQFAPYYPGRQMHLWPGLYHGAFWLAIDDNSSNSDVVVKIEVARLDTIANQTVLAYRYLTRDMWTDANVFEDFTLPFEIGPRTLGEIPPILQLRVLWYGNAKVSLKRVLLR